ncbi:hypothetical protein [Streptomyces sp. NPDC051569]
MSENGVLDPPYAGAADLAVRLRQAVGRRMDEEPEESADGPR